MPKKLAVEKHIVNRVIVKVDNSKISKGDLETLYKIRPNSKSLIFFRFKLWIHKKADTTKGKATWFKKKLIENFSEPPVYVDTNLINLTKKQFVYYLNNNGYFDSKVNHNLKYKRKIVNIIYNINTAKPYIINKVNYNIDDNAINNFIKDNHDEPLLKVGDIYNINNIIAERDRLTKYIRNNGFYFFSKDYISFENDTSEGKNHVNINVNIKEVSYRSEENPDSILTTYHRQFKINKIFINTQYNPLELDSGQIKFDTLVYNIYNKKSQQTDKYYFLYRGKLKLNPTLITQSIFFKSGDVFRLYNVDKTYNALSEIKLFKITNIQFIDVTEKVAGKGSNLGYIDCKITCTRNYIQSSSIEAEGTNTSGNMGVATNFSYVNKNLFRGAENLNLRFVGAMEIQKTFADNEKKNWLQRYIPFNTLEAGADAKLEIPRFLIPFVSPEMFPKSNLPKTSFFSSLNYQKRPDFTRYSANATFGYEWKSSKNSKIYFNPLMVNSVKLYNDSILRSKLKAINDQKLLNSYQDHMITAFGGSYIYTNQKASEKNNFRYLRINAELGYPITGFLKQYYDKDGDPYAFNMKYAQYYSVDGDYRKYYYLRKNQAIVFRVGGGWSRPLKPTLNTPFEKSFSLGGANDLRAWKMRSLGPGSYHDSANTNMERIGDIMLKANVEYRFPIWSLINGALFVDAGNIWLWRPNNKIVGGEFQTKDFKFIDDIGIGSGFGLRFDLSFFLIRFDAAVRIKDPSKPENNRWINKSVDMTNVFFNFGIGYPF